jgi:hypothetical protein
MASDASSPPLPTAAISLDVPPPPNVSWALNTLMEDDLLEMEAHGLIPEKAISRWMCCYGQEFPTEDRTEMVVF